jgi:HEAT repeat protein
MRRIGVLSGLLADDPEGQSRMKTWRSIMDWWSFWHGHTLGRLKSNNTREVIEAAGRLGKLRDPRAIGPLLDAAGREGYSAVFEAVAEALARIGPSCVKHLIEALEDRRAFVRSTAKRALGKIGDSRAIQPLLNAAEREGNSFAIKSTADALVQIGSSSIEILVQALDDQHAFVRLSAAEALWRLGDPRGIETLLDVAANSQSAASMTIVADALVRLGTSTDRLIRALQEGPVCMRATAAEALGKLGDRSALAPLVAVVESACDDVLRIAAVKALGKLGDRRGLAPLVTIRESASDALRIAAAKAITAPGGATGHEKRTQPAAKEQYVKDTIRSGMLPDRPTLWSSFRHPENPGSRPQGPILWRCLLGNPLGGSRPDDDKRLCSLRRRHTCNLGS